MKKELRPVHDAVSCDVCGRTILKGEHAEWYLAPGGHRRQVCDLCAVADQIDHVCQLAGSSLHAAIGSDLDGGYGQEQTPHDLDTIADLQKVGDLLRARG